MKNASKSPLMVGPLIPWLCSYKSSIGRCSIILYGTSSDEVIENNSSILNEMKVDGILCEVLPFETKTEKKS